MYFMVYVFLASLLAVYAYVRRYYRQIRLATSLPGPKAYPIIGNYNIMRTDGGNYYNENQRMTPTQVPN